MMNTALAGPSNRQAHRPLREPVLESVDAEFGAQAAQQSGPMPEASRAGGNGVDTSGSFWWEQMRQQLSEQMKAQPTRSALLAFGVGALAALLIAQGLRRSRGTF